MTRSLLTSVALCAAIATTAWAQSPPASATVTVGGKNISIRYSAPSVRGRKIFGDGGLLSRDPTYPAWRARANSAPKFHTHAGLRGRGPPCAKGPPHPDVW